MIIDLNFEVFDRVSMEPSIFVLSGASSSGPVRVGREESRKAFEEMKLVSAERENWEAPNWRIVFSRSSKLASVLESALSNSKAIGECFEVRSGLQAYERGKGNPPQSAEDVKSHVFDREEREDAQSVRYLGGKDVGRYQLSWSGLWMQYGTWLAQPRELSIFTRPRVLIREITSPFPRCLNSTFTEAQYLNNKSVLNILHPTDDVAELKCLLGLLNSKFMSAYYKQYGVKSARKLFPKIVIRNVREFPFPCDLPADQREALAELVDHTLLLNAQTSSTTQQSKKILSNQIDATDRQIDQLVYGLYGLTDEEIKVVEEAVS